MCRDSNRKKSMLKKMSTLKPLENKNSPQYIVSLTSFGKRLTLTVPYTIISLFEQTIQPDRIILWVGEGDREKVGDDLRKLEKIGLEIRYCEDIGSYTKLIPSLKEFPEDNIITADDDIYYPYNWLEQLIAEHEKYPHKIICHRVRELKVDKNCNLLPYSEWPIYIIRFPIPANNRQSKDRSSSFSIFPTGVGGILYPPKSLDKQVSNKELFMKLAPKADDIWFWAMALINKEVHGEESPYLVIENGYSHKLQSVDHSQQRNGNALVNYNVAKKGNDEQMKLVVDYFPQLKEVLSKIRY